MGKKEKIDTFSFVCVAEEVILKSSFLFNQTWITVKLCKH